MENMQIPNKISTTIKNEDLIKNSNQDQIQKRFSIDEQNKKITEVITP